MPQSVPDLHLHTCTTCTTGVSISVDSASCAAGCMRVCRMCAMLCGVMRMCFSSIVRDTRTGHYDTRINSVQTVSRLLPSHACTPASHAPHIRQLFMQHSECTRLKSSQTIPYAAHEHAYAHTHVAMLGFTCFFKYEAYGSNGSKRVSSA